MVRSLAKNFESFSAMIVKKGGVDFYGRSSFHQENYYICENFLHKRLPNDDNLAVRGIFVVSAFFVRTR